jgi:hypothetical protein
LNCANTGVGTASCAISNVVAGDLHIASLGINLFQDPSIETSFGVQNWSSTGSQRFTLVFTMSVASIPGGTLTGGSTAFTYLDNTGDGVTLSAPAGSALYTALIDGAQYQKLLADPTSGSTAVGFDGGTLGPADFGTPIPSQSGPAVTTSIGIKYDFNLTGGDGVSVGDSTDSTGKFTVKPVPEPSPALLVALGLVGLATAARRR